MSLLNKSIMGSLFDTDPYMNGAGIMQGGQVNPNQQVVGNQMMNSQTAVPFGGSQTGIGAPGVGDQTSASIPAVDQNEVTEVQADTGGKEESSIVNRIMEGRAANSEAGDKARRQLIISAVTAGAGGAIGGAMGGAAGGAASGAAGGAAGAAGAGAAGGAAGAAAGGAAGGGMMGNMMSGIMGGGGGQGMGGMMGGMMGGGGGGGGGPMSMLGGMMPQPARSKI